MHTAIITKIIRMTTKSTDRAAGGRFVNNESDFGINYITFVISGKYCNFIDLRECDLSINRTVCEL